MGVPESLLYSAEHEWVAGVGGEGGSLTVGITAHAAEALGDLVFVELPSEGDAVVAGEPCGELESTKAVSELYAPVSGTVSAVNTSLKDNPSTINEDPYGEGWIFKVTSSIDPEDLMDADAYTRLIKSA